MNDTTISKEEIMTVFPRIAEVMADALGCDVEKVRPDASLIDDLGAESIDFLDIVFRLERAFKVKIPRGKIVEEARGELSEAQFEKGGVVSEAGLARLKVFLEEVPAHRFKPKLTVAEIPRLFTTETFCKLVIRQQRLAARASTNSPACSIPIVTRQPTWAASSAARLSGVTCSRRST